MDHSLQIGDACLDCQQLGLCKKLKEFFINENEKIIKCESNSCIFPYADDFSSEENPTSNLEPIVANEKETECTVPSMVDSVTVHSAHVTSSASAPIFSSDDFLASLNLDSCEGLEEKFAAGSDKSNLTEEIFPSKMSQDLPNVSALHESIDFGFDLSFITEDETDPLTDLLHETLEKEIRFQTAVNSHQFDTEAKTAKTSEVFIIPDEILLKPTQVTPKCATNNSTKTPSKAQQQTETDITKNIQITNFNGELLAAASFNSQRPTSQQAFECTLNRKKIDAISTALNSQRALNILAVSSGRNAITQKPQPGVEERSVSTDTKSYVVQMLSTDTNLQQSQIASTGKLQLIETASNTQQTQIMTNALKTQQFNSAEATLSMEETHTLPATKRSLPLATVPECAINCEQTKITSSTEKFEHQKSAGKSIALMPQHLKFATNTDMNFQETHVIPIAKNLQQFETGKLGTTISSENSEITATDITTQQFISNEATFNRQETQTVLETDTAAAITEQQLKTSVNSQQSLIMPTSIPSQHFETTTESAINDQQAQRRPTTILSQQSGITTPNTMNSPTKKIIVNASNLEELTTSLKTALISQKTKILPNTINVQLLTLCRASDKKSGKLVPKAVSPQQLRTALQAAIDSPQREIILKGSSKITKRTTKSRRSRKTPVKSTVSSQQETIACDSQTVNAETTPKVAAMSIVDFESTASPSMGCVFTKTSPAKISTNKRKTKDNKETPNDFIVDSDDSKSSITDVMNFLKNI